MSALPDSSYRCDRFVATARAKRDSRGRCRQRPRRPRGGVMPRLPCRGLSRDLPLLALAVAATALQARAAVLFVAMLALLETRHALMLDANQGRAALKEPVPLLVIA